MESINYKRLSFITCCHRLATSSCHSALFFGFVSCDAIKFHKFLIGFRSELWAGQFKISTLLASNHSFVVRDFMARRIVLLVDEIITQQIVNTKKHEFFHCFYVFRTIHYQSIILSRPGPSDEMHLQTRHLHLAVWQGCRLVDIFQF